MAEQHVERRLAAILAADVVSYSRLMGQDEVGTRARFNAHIRELIEPAIASRRGRIVKTTGDALLVEFASVVDAVQCAVEIQNGMAERNTDESDDRRIVFRIGVNLGDVIIEGDDIHGDGVNVAARLEALAEPSDVVVSGIVHELVRAKLDFNFVDLGPQTVKNIGDPVPAYRVCSANEEVLAAGQETSVLLTLPDKPSIAVLPFKNMSDDPEQEYFADGITEDIITALSRFRWFFVIARNSSFTYKGHVIDVKQVAKELGVQYVLEGSVRRAGDRVRITAQLVEAAAARHIWAERYDRELHDVFAVQDEISEAITGAVAPSFVSAEAQKAIHKPPESFDAWDCALHGNWYLWQAGRENTAEARRLFEAAVELDPKSAVALSGYAIACGWQLLFGWTNNPIEDRRAAYNAAKRAVSLDDQDAWAQVALSLLSTQTGEHDAAFRAALRAVELNPNMAIAEAVLAQRYAWHGNYDHAILHADRAARLSPRDPTNWFWTFARTVAAFTAGNYEESLKWAKDLTEKAPDFPGGWSLLAVDNAYLGYMDNAEAAAKQFVGIVPKASIRFVRSLLPARRPEDAERLLDGMRKAGLPE